MPAANLAIGNEKIRERIRSGFGGGLAELAASRGARVVAVSTSAAEEARKFYGVKVDRVIENGVDCELFRPRDKAEARARLGWPSEARIALFAGRAEPRKSPEVALAASRMAGFDLAVAGARSVEGALNLGSLTPQDLAWTFAAADCVVFPSHYEACSYVVLEALAAGVPLITTRVGWTRDIDVRVPGYSLFLTSPDVPQVARAMRVAVEEDVSEIVSAARNLVVTNNSRERFETQWREFAASVSIG
jgi:glycosyltransferase involved in cell wall biosynthesis